MESILVAILAALLGLAALSIGLKIIRTSRMVKRWPTVTGTVVEREVALSMTGSVSTPGTRYQARVKYAYVVADQEYVSDKIIAYGTLTGSHAAMQKELDGLSGPVEVHYDPANPAEACLKREPAWWAFGALAAAASCFLVSLVTLVTLAAPGK